MTGTTLLLPPNATRLEQAFDGAVASRFPLPTDLVSAMWDADRCPARLLGFLAYQLSVDLWDDDWPETTKRNVCRNALRLHRLKTTLAGIRAHIALTGAELAEVIRPPARLFVGAAMTPAERETWLMTLPQIRLYPFQRRELARHLLVTRRTKPTFLRRAYARGPHGPKQYGTRAALWDRGSERDIAFTRPDADTLRFALPRARRGAYVGHAFLRRLFPAPPASAEALVTLRLSGDIGGFAVAAGLDPVSIEPTRVAEPFTSAPPRAFVGRARGRYALPAAGPRHLYDRVALHDPTRVAARRARVFMGHARLGYVPFRAELRVAAPFRRNPLRFGRWMGRGFLLDDDRRQFEAIGRAIGVSRAARDTVLYTTATHARVTFRDGLRFGDFRFGDWRKVA